MTVHIYVGDIGVRMHIPIFVIEKVENNLNG